MKLLLPAGAPLLGPDGRSVLTLSLPHFEDDEGREFRIPSRAERRARQRGRPRITRADQLARLVRRVNRGN